MDENVVTIEEIDNGGANAKKGFNYQDAIATLIIICNYSKDDFCIYLECRDDIEVDINSHKFFIQVKSTKQSIASLTKETKKKDGSVNKSILYKNLNKSSKKSNRYKIVTTSYTDAVSSIDGLLFKDVYEYTDEQKQFIAKKLKTQGLSDEDINEKLNNSHVYVSPFRDNLEEACNHLIGFMNKNGICVDNGRGEILLNEILHDIHIKSEKKIIVDTDREKKKIKKEELVKLAKVEKCFEYMEQLTNKLENAEFINLADKIQINKYIRIVDLKHKAEYKNVENNLSTIDKTGKPENKIKEVHDILINKINIDTNLLYAILIDKYVMEAYI